MPECGTAPLLARKSKMKRDTTMAVLALLMLAGCIPAYAANKETIQLEEQVKLLGNQMTSMLGLDALVSRSNGFVFCDLNRYF